VSLARLLTTAPTPEEQTGSAMAIFDTLFFKTLTANKRAHYSHLPTEILIGKLK